jgi:NADH:ubiquinone oxidoreductase subunit E
MSETTAPDGASPTGPSDAEVLRLLDSLEVSPHSNLIGLLQDVQNRFGWLPPSAVQGISRLTRIPLSRIYGVVTFYAQFYTEPRGKHIILCCRGTACHVRGAARMIDQVAAHLDIEPGDTTSDGLFTLESVSCLGACALGPVVVLDEVYHDHMTGSRLNRLVESVRRDEAEGGPDA